MVENVHYLKIDRELSNLAEISAVVASNSSEEIQRLKNIPDNAFSLAMSATYPKEVHRVASELGRIFGRNDRKREGWPFSKEKKNNIDTFVPITAIN